MAKETNSLHMYCLFMFILASVENYTRLRSCHHLMTRFQRVQHLHKRPKIPEPRKWLSSQSDCDGSGFTMHVHRVISNKWHRLHLLNSDCLRFLSKVAVDSLRPEKIGFPQRYRSLSGKRGCGGKNCNCGKKKTPN